MTYIYKLYHFFFPVKKVKEDKYAILKQIVAKQKATLPKRRIKEIIKFVEYWKSTFPKEKVKEDKYAILKQIVAKQKLPKRRMKEIIKFIEYWKSTFPKEK